MRGSGASYYRTNATEWPVICAQRISMDQLVSGVVRMALTFPHLPALSYY